MPCDYRILRSPTKGQVLLVLWETVERSQCVETINPGLAPWAVQEYRPIGARLCFLHQSTNHLLSPRVALIIE